MYLMVTAHENGRSDHRFYKRCGKKNKTEEGLAMHDNLRDEMEQRMLRTSSSHHTFFFHSLFSPSLYTPEREVPSLTREVFFYHGFAK